MLYESLKLNNTLIANLPGPNEKNITYSYNQNILNSYDIYLPESKFDDAPLLIWIHGGAWVSGDKSDYYYFAKQLANNGIATALVNYRLSSREKNGPFKYPGHALDCLNAFLYILRDSNHLKYSPNNIFIGGHSAGAQLASLIALKPEAYLSGNQEEKNEKLSQISKIKGVVSLGGIFDLGLLSEQDESYKNDFLIPAFGEDLTNNNKELSSWEEASPQSMAKNDIKNLKYKQLPSILLMHSIQDTLVNQSQAINFDAKLKSLNFTNIAVNQGKYGNHYDIPNHLDVINGVTSFILYVSKIKPSLFKF
ncbi:alpha/beta-hydrolase [Neoconidiobolus thromboides FSU 785]|nr:alpha/beta-hydrolase [Neoconidiobolus thromboides FSU 785]